jgi:hypothetical protein
MMRAWFNGGLLRPKQRSFEINASPNKEFFQVTFHNTLFQCEEVSFRVVVITWELVADPLGSSEHILGTIVLDVFSLDTVKLCIYIYIYIYI